MFDIYIIIILQWKNRNAMVALFSETRFSTIVVFGDFCDHEKSTQWVGVQWLSMLLTVDPDVGKFGKTLQELLGF